jgi:hypothetical protein
LSDEGVQSLVAEGEGALLTVLSTCFVSLPPHAVAPRVATRIVADPIRRPASAFTTCISRTPFKSTSIKPAIEKFKQEQYVALADVAVTETEVGNCGAYECDAGQVYIKACRALPVHDGFGIKIMVRRKLGRSLEPIG